MKILLVHNRYRSTAPSGENRVVDQELAALAALGHDVGLFERRSDEIEDWPAWKKATLPARVVWNPAGNAIWARRCAAPAGRGPRAQHLPGAESVRAVRLPRRGRSGRDHAAQLQAAVCQWRLLPRRRDLSRLCRRQPARPACVHRCYRGSALATATTVLNTRSHRRQLARPGGGVRVHLRVAARLLAGLRFDPDRSFVRYNYVPYDGPVGRPATDASSDRSRMSAGSTRRRARPC